MNDWKKQAKHKGNGIKPTLLMEIGKALNSLNGWGSVEIYVQSNRVVQITARSIRKTEHILES